MSFDLTNTGSTLQTSGGPGSGVMGGRYWDQDGVDDVVWAADADLGDLKANESAITVLWWVRNSSNDVADFANHWAVGNDGGIQVRQVRAEDNVRADVNDTDSGSDLDVESGGGAITEFGDPAEWHMLRMTYDGTTLALYVIDNGTGTETLLGDGVGGLGDIVWGPDDYTIGCQDDGGAYEDFRAQHIVPPIFFDTVLTGTQAEAIWAARNGDYEGEVLDLNPIHFINEADGLTDTTGVSGAVSMGVADSQHGHTSDQAGLDPAYTVAPADSGHAHTSDVAALAAAYTVTVDDTAHGHTSDVAALDVAYTIVVDDTDHGHTSDTVTIASAGALTPADSTHGHTSGPVDLAAAYTMAVDGTTHGHSSDVAALAAAYTVTVADTAHGHTSGPADLAAAYTLVVDRSGHVHTSGTVTIVDATLVVDPVLTVATTGIDAIDVGAAVDTVAVGSTIDTVTATRE